MNQSGFNGISAKGFESSLFGLVGFEIMGILKVFPQMSYPPHPSRDSEAFLRDSGFCCGWHLSCQFFSTHGWFFILLLEKTLGRLQAKLLGLGYVVKHLRHETNRPKFTSVLVYILAIGFSSPNVAVCFMPLMEFSPLISQCTRMTLGPTVGEKSSYSNWRCSQVGPPEKRFALQEASKEIDEWNAGWKCCWGGFLVVSCDGYPV